MKETNKKSFLPVLIVVLLLVMALAVILKLLPAKTPVQSAVPAESGESIYADIVIKDYGTITVKLEPQYAPLSVERFTMLAESGFYNGLTFHRIMEGFMMQGGDPNGNGTGGYSEDLKGEFAANGVRNPINHTRGTISFARSQNYDSASSQFFIMHKDYPSLDGQYAAFGRVTEGIEIVDAICESAEPVDAHGSILPEQQPVIETITIRSE